MPAYYRATLVEFLADDDARILGMLATESAGTGFTDLKQKQTKAWQKQITAMKITCSSLVAKLPNSAQWSLLFEYPIPRRQKRIDAVLLSSEVILCIEFKTEEKKYNRQLHRQAEDYALDLRDFHDQSRERRIVPIAVALKAEPTAYVDCSASDDWVRPVIFANADDLSEKIVSAVGSERKTKKLPIDADAWDLSAYRPVPTIIEAAEALYAGHNVREIAHFHAEAINLTQTSDKLIEIIKHAQRDNLKIACFVTGVPGAGKTLAGLNIVHNPTLRTGNRQPGVFLSGNGPLVKIVSAAIARDHKRRVHEGGAERTTSTFIQNIHTFVRDSLEKPDKPPVEHVIVFDEAQRAWDAAHNAKKTGSDISEPETVLSIMDRHQDWSVVVALVGGGQEIHDGEAGLAEWGRTLRESFSHWQIAVSPEALSGDSSVAGHRLFADGNNASLSIRKEPALHLKVNLRSFRARRLTEWVDAVLSGNAPKAANIIADLKDFPFVLTRSLPTTRAWLRDRARGLRRCGLVASSGATRLRAEGIELSSGFRQGNRDLYVHWFLADPADVRSSNQLEIVASEFECQGLELDWVGICWGGNFTFDTDQKTWAFHNFSGNSWRNIGREVDRQYLLNTYRVLLTRAREGSIIWIPMGNDNDLTRASAPLNATAQYLKHCGLPTI